MKTLQIKGLPPLGRVGFGTWQLGSREWGYGEEYAERTAGQIVKRAVELGVNFFDTAEFYGFGRSEQILSQALGDDREHVVVATKFFPIAPLPALVRRSAHASARRLRVNQIPLYQVHWANPVVNDSVIMPGLRGLQADGVINQVGVSNYSRARWEKADAALGRPVVSNQVQFSLAHPQPLDELVGFAEKNDRLIIAYSPLAMGLLGGRYDEHTRPKDFRRTTPLFSTASLRRASTLLDAVREIAVVHQVKPAQIALAWLLHQPNVLVIPGASSVEQLEFNVAAAEIELTDSEVASLTTAAREFSPVSPLEALAGEAKQRLGRLLP